MLGKLLFAILLSMVGFLWAQSIPADTRLKVERFMDIVDKHTERLINERDMNTLGTIIFDHEFEVRQARGAEFHIAVKESAMYLQEVSKSYRLFKKALEKAIVGNETQLIYGSKITDRDALRKLRADVSEGYEIVRDMGLLTALSTLKEGDPRRDSVLAFIKFVEDWFVYVETKQKR